MKPWKRIGMNLLLPSPIAALLTQILGELLNKDGPEHGTRLSLGSGIILLIMLSYLYGIIPSAAFTASMELAYRRGVGPRSTSAVAVSAIVGAFICIVFALIVVGLFHARFQSPAHIAGAAGAIFCIGAGTGLIVGFLVKFAASRGGGRGPDVTVSP
jgi:hypothetical protein